MKAQTQLLQILYAVIEFVIKFR